MNGFKVSPKLLTIIILAVIAGIGFYLRTVLPYAQVFRGEWVKFTSNDAYYHMRLVDSIAHNFPHIMKWDFYLLYPGVTGVKVGFFDWLLGAVIWAVGLGNPSQQMIDTIGVYYPAVLAVLTVIPAYFIGKTMFGRPVGMLAAALLMVIPGEYIGRSILGFTDNHVAETLLTTTTVMFLLLALKTARQGGLTFTHLLRRDWGVIKKPLIYSLFTGLFLGIYLITWTGALLFVFIFIAYLVIQFIVDHLRGRSTDYLTVIGVVLFLTGLAILCIWIITVWSNPPPSFIIISLVLAAVIPVVCSALSRFMKGRGLKPGYYPLVLLGTGAVALLVFFLAAPSTFRTMLGQFSILVPRGGLTTLEMGPLFSPRGEFTFAVAWGNFTTGFFLTFGYLCFLLFYRKLYQRRDDAGENFLLVWSIVILMATLAQRRFAYYFAVNVAVITGYLSWFVIWRAGLQKLLERRSEEKTVTKAKVKKVRRSGITVYHINAALAVLVVFFFIFAPNVWIKGASVDVASRATFAIPDSWYEAMDWMRENTPEPFGDPAFYYEFYDPATYKYPESAYGVMTWWDYGYWVTRIAHRVPNANPSQPPGPIRDTARFFLSQDEASAEELIEKMGSSYIVIDNQTTTSKIWAVWDWAGEESSKYFDVFYLPQENNLVPINLFYPEYYRSLAVRLYNFDGKAVSDVKPAVITFEERSHPNVGLIKQVTGGGQFDSYQEALDFIRSQNSPNVRIVSDQAFISPVPLEALQDYELVYSSTSGSTQSGVGFMPGVKVFQYLGR